MIEALTEFIASHGYLAVGLLMLVENVFPPIPSELIMPFAGFVAARGDLHLAGVVAAGTFGSVIGGLPWFLLARRWGADRLKQAADRHGRWLTVSRGDIERSQTWFQRHGAPVLVFGRLVPGVRTMIAVPAGFARMGTATFVVWTTLGSALWSGVLAGAGYALEGQYDRIAAVIDPASKFILAALVVAYGVRVWRAGRATR